MCGTLLSVRAHACVIAQCHGSDLVSRYRCAERTYGRQGEAAGGGTSVWGRTGAAGPGSEEGGSDRASVPSASRAPGSTRRGHIRSGVTPKTFCGGGATRRRGGAAVCAHGKKEITQPDENPKMTQNYIRITMTI